MLQFDQSNRFVIDTKIANDTPICHPEQREGSAFTRTCCRNDEILRLRLRMTILVRPALHFVNELANTYKDDNVGIA